MAVQPARRPAKLENLGFSLGYRTSRRTQKSSLPDLCKISFFCVYWLQDYYVTLRMYEIKITSYIIFHTLDTYMYDNDKYDVFPTLWFTNFVSYIFFIYS